MNQNNGLPQQNIKYDQRINYKNIHNYNKLIYITQHDLCIYVHLVHHVVH